MSRGRGKRLPEVHSEAKVIPVDVSFQSRARGLIALVSQAFPLAQAETLLGRVLWMTMLELDRYVNGDPGLDERFRQQDERDDRRTAQLMHRDVSAKSRSTTQKAS